MNRSIRFLVAVLAASICLTAGGAFAGEGGQEDPFGSVLPAQQAQPSAPGAPKALQAIQEMQGPKGYDAQKGAFQDLRPSSMAETSRTLGVQAGVAWRYQQIVESLEGQSGNLDSIFDFRPLLLHDGKVMPPVIAEALGGFRLESETEATGTEVTYQILQPAKIVTLAPSWRDYLVHTFPAMAEVNPALLPRNDVEREVWRVAAQEGWELGIKQGDRVYEANLNRLVRDYRGALRFRVLAAQKVVSVPMLAEGRYGVQIGDNILDVNQRVFRITAPAEFQKVDAWKPLVAKPSK